MLIHYFCCWIIVRHPFIPSQWIRHEVVGGLNIVSSLLYNDRICRLLLTCYVTRMIQSPTNAAPRPIKLVIDAEKAYRVPRACNSLVLLPSLYIIFTPNTASILSVNLLNMSSGLVQIPASQIPLTQSDKDMWCVTSLISNQFALALTRFESVFL